MLDMKNKINNIANKIGYNGNKRIQQREIIVEEFSDGTFDFDAVMWKLTIPKKRATEFFAAWRKGLLDENHAFQNALAKNNIDNKKPKILDGVKNNQ